jgi:hypothetical protein
MTSNPEQRPGRATCTIEITPSEALAGAPLTVKAAAACGDDRDLRGFACHLEDADGSVVCRFDLAMYDGMTNRAHDVELAAPASVGEHTLTMVFPQQAKGGTVYEEARAETTITVKPHPVHVTVWGQPGPARTGEPFTVFVGAKGGTPGAMAGKTFTVRDAEGAVVSEGVLGSDAWRGTTALHAAEATLVAPQSAAIYRWTAHVAGFDDPLPHADGSRDFTVTIVDPPRHEVTVKVRDHETEAPVRGVQVVMHPFRATTDDDGVARVKVASGDHRLFVSGYNYETFRTALKVEGDVHLEANLIREVEEDPADLYA